MKRWLFVSLIIALFPSLFYLFCLSPGVSWEDSGEFITTASSLGIAHPPGHPLYINIAHLFTIHSPPQSIAHAVNLFSVIAAFLAVVLFSLLLLMLSGSVLRGKSRMLIFLAVFPLTLLFAFSETFWHVAEIAEVYSLHALLTLALLASLFLIVYRSGRFLLLFSYLLGLSLTNNVTIAYLIPACACFLILERKRVGKRFILPAILLFLLGLSLYFYMPLRARFHPVFNWGNASNLKNFIHLLTAREFSKGVTSLAYAETALFPTFLQLLREISFWGIVPLIIGFIALFRKKRNIAMLFLIAIISNILLSLFTGRGPDFRAYFLPSIILFFLIIGYGIMVGIGRLKKNGWIAILLLFLLVLFPLVLNYQQNCARNDTDARNYGYALLRWLPEEAVLLTENTNDYFILTYLTEVETTHDIDILYAPLFKESWYRERLSASGFQWEDPLTPLSFANGTPREVFYTPGAGISLPFGHLSPHGPIFRIVMDEEPMAGAHFNLPHPLREQGKQRSAYLYARFGEYYFGRKAYPAAIKAFERAREYDSDNPAIYHNLALLYRKMGDTPKAAYYGEEAKRLGFQK